MPASRDEKPIPGMRNPPWSPRRYQEDGGEGLTDGRTARICDPFLRQADARPVANTWGVS
jgi:hypothetical protein